MGNKIISGTEIAKEIEDDLKLRVEKLKKAGIIPKLVVILIGENPASLSYIRQKEKSAKKVGIESEVRQFSGITEKKILEEIKKINNDKNIHGVIVQLPLPKHISREKILAKIDPKKDVDGFTAENLGKLMQGEKCLECCTPKGIIKMLEVSGETLEGKNVVVIGRSNVVGKPVASLCLNKNATVTICHSRTKNLRESLKYADIVIVAVGKPKFIKGEDLPENCVVIDVGIHRIEVEKNGEKKWKLCGDVDFDSVISKVAKISPVPGGVGPMTVVSLIENTIESAENSAK